MKLERLHEYVLPVVVTLLGMGFAVYVGYLMGQGQFSKVALYLGVLFMGFLTLLMRQYIWLLIIVTWPWAAAIPILPVPFAVRDLGVLAAFVSFAALIALKVARRKARYDIADLMMLAVLVYLVTVFIRNPVGFLSMNSMRVGGRPYINIALAFMAYLILARASFPFRSGSKVIIFTILASNYLIGAMNIIADLSPRAARVLTTFYSGLSVEMDNAPASNALPPGETVERLAYLGGIGIPTAQALTAFFRPLTLVNPLYFLRFAALGFSFICVMMSGFRSGLLFVMALIIIGSYLRAGWMEVVRLTVFGFLGVMILVLCQGRLFDMPLSAQRALTFLPGKWSPVAKSDAEGSSTWRFEMWKQMLTSNKYIKSRLFGDGFGVTKRDMAIIAMLADRPGAGQESTMIVGTVHSGPISTIRVAGYVGLAIYLTLLGLIARKAWVLVRKTRGSPFEPLAYFFGLPLIYEPFNYVVVFGGFDSSVPTMIYGLGTLKLLENSFDDYVGVEREAESVADHHSAEPVPALAGTR